MVISKLKMSLKSKILGYVKSNTVTLIALCAAIFTSFIITPDKQYLGYFDFKTLSCLFCTLAVVCALKNINFFYILAKKVVRFCKNARLCILAIVYITFIGSMLIANDMALLTFLPLGYFALSSTEKEKYMAFTFIMQNTAANLGGMLTPFGNPQNLYLYTKFEIPTLEFIKIMAPPFTLSVVLITICCIVFVKPEPLSISHEKTKLNKQRALIYLLLFALSVVIVFRIIPYTIGLVVITVCLLFWDKKALASVDYGLLLTFVFFFVFAGNMARIQPVRDFFGMLLEKNTLVFSVASCQFISNVPSAILLSQFTHNYPDLLVGVNIGGVGTIIASLASLITFREYFSHYPHKAGKYLALFSLFNVAFVVILTVFQSLI